MSKEELIVVAIGCSAGGLEACRELIKALPTENICYVLCQHLSPTHTSLLKEILTPDTTLKVMVMSDGSPLNAGHFYVPLPNTNIEIRNNLIVLRKPSIGSLAKPNIDKLLVSLAADKHSLACAIILSGSGNDGAKGIIDIKNNDGLVFAQSPDDCQYDSMPRSAIATHIVDVVDTPHNIAKYLSRLIDRDHKQSPAVFLNNNKSFFDIIIKRIAAVTGVDFTQYRDSSLQRRLARRLQFLGVENIETYTKKLQNDEQETWQLMQSVFVVVSEFYRDKSAFIALEKRIAEEIASNTINNEFRIWVPGCATGEEVYTLAMIMEDITENIATKIRYKILATDLAHNALATARKGEYEPDKLVKMPPHWREKYFTAEGENLIVNSYLRENIVFSVHDVLTDPPFSKIDLISCRNLIIYFDENVQERLFKTFSYALKNNSFLFLGSSEVCNNKELFSTADEKHKIYRRNRLSKKDLVNIGLPNIRDRNIEVTHKNKKENLESKIYKAAYSLFSPPMIVINDTHEIIFKEGDHHHLISSGTGIIEKDLFSNINEDLRPEIRALLFKVKQSGKKETGNQHITTNDDDNLNFSIVIEPIMEANSTWYLIYLDAKTSQTGKTQHEPNTGRNILNELDKELSETRENLQIVIEELESTNEQMQIYNEELQSSNEEYQSTNEELQTVNEELQSTNEELTTMNEEYEIQTSLFQNAKNDLINIQESVDIPLILISQEYRIKRFTSCCDQLLDLTKIKEDDLIFAVEWYCDINLLKPLLKEVSENRTPIKTEVIIGNEFYDCQISPYINGNNEFDGYTIIFYCTSNFKHAQTSLLSEKTLAQKTLETIMEGVIRIDSDLTIQYANELSAELSGWQLKSMIGKPVSRVLRLYQENEEYPIEKTLQKAIDMNETFRSQDTPLLLKTRRGKDINMELCFSPVLMVDKKPSNQGGVIAFRDVTALHKQMKTLMWNSTHDGLTGLINRKEIEKRLDSAIITARRNRINSTLLYLDLDQFKVVNDTCGHEAGDLLLQQISQLMMEMLRTRDTLARLGGDEFALLLDKCPLHEAESIALKLQKTIADYRFLWNEKIFHVTASIGMIEIHEDSYHVSELLRQADTACYQAKESGRNTIEIFTNSNNELEEKRAQMHSVADINHAIESDDFLLYFQEVCSLNDTQSRWEVLIRMYKKPGDFMLPGAFLPAAERFGLITRIDIWVLKKSIQLISKLSAANQNITPSITINMSGATLGNEEYLTTLRSLLEHHKVDPSCICFELTETAAVSFYIKAKNYLEKISAMGCLVALDDFGSGMSSLAYLRDLPLDIVKIDGSFIRGIVDDPVNRTIVKSVKEVAELLNLKVVAECVETEAQYKILKDQGVDLVQGFFVGRPIPFEEFSALALSDP